MAKQRSQFVCQQCGYESPKWLGKCTECGTWNSFVETVIANTKSQSIRQNHGGQAKIETLATIKTEKLTRISTKISEFDRALGGGIVPGQVILLAGEPGIGKSTLLLEVVNTLGGLYVSGEESVSQIAIRAERLKIKNPKINLLEETNIDDLLASAQNLMPEIVIIDSIQTMTTSDLSGLAGSVGQIRECTSRIVKFAKSTGIPVFVVGHVTKEKSIAGPSTLMHMVDTVLWFEGEKNLDLRLIRAVKNRFGPTDEVGIFRMNDKGLEPIDDSGSIFLDDISKKTPGSVITCILEGTRPIFVEVQSLVVPTKLAFPKRVAQGIDIRRLEVILAVLTKRCGLPLYDNDVFVNIAGGISTKEPGADLGIALSLASSYFNKSASPQTIAIGEVGLLGEIRIPAQIDKRIKEAKRLGYKNILSGKEYKDLPQVIHKIFKSK